MPTIEALSASLQGVHVSTGSLTTSLDDVRAVSDAELLRAQQALSDARRSIDACSAIVAGEIANRSRRELGYAGLAQREGFRTPEAMVQHATGSSSREASALVKVGTMMHDARTAVDESDAAGPDDERKTGAWLRTIGAAVSDGVISVASADALRIGLTKTAPALDAYLIGLGDVIEGLIDEVKNLDVDGVLRRAREVRDELDAAGIADRERAIYEERGIRRVRRSNGVSRYIVDPDLESGAFWDDLYDSLTSPRRGGVRFVDEEQKTWADEVAADPRTIEQYVHDCITELLRISATADDLSSRRIVGGRMPAVRVLVSEPALAARVGSGRIEGCETPVSIETVERIACSAGTVGIRFDEHGQVLDLGREQRLFSARQKVALAARDGGCRAPGCSRPPSWTEAHHVRHWKRDRGATNVVDGILLCRHHHMLLHNNHWEIERRGADYWLIPPADVDPGRAPRLMPSKSAALRDLQRVEVALRVPQRVEVAAAR